MDKQHDDGGSFYAFLWLLGFFIIIGLFFIVPAVLAYFLGIGLAMHGHSPLWGWVGLPIVLYPLIIWVLRSTDKDFEKKGYFDKDE